VKFLFSEQAWEDYQYWLATDNKVAKWINQLIRDSARDPFRKTGAAAAFVKGILVVPDQQGASNSLPREGRCAESGTDSPPLQKL